MMHGVDSVGVFRNHVTVEQEMPARSDISQHWNHDVEVRTTSSEHIWTADRPHTTTQ